MNDGSWNGTDFDPLPRGLFAGGVDMKKTIVLLCSAVLVACAPSAFAQGVSNKTPGHEMQEKGSKMDSPGASGYSPGHEMQAKGSRKGSPGASGYAPGQTSGSNTRSK
jgi:hypothetical protein